MNEVRVFHLNLLLILAFVPLVTPGQDSSAGAPASATPSAEQSKTPPGTPPPAKEKKKAKKVWTNDEISSVKGGVSVVGKQDSSADDGQAGNAYQANSRKTLKQQHIHSYRAQIKQLQDQIDAADKRISQLKNFKGESTAPSGGINPTHPYNMLPLGDQVKQLEEHKKQLRAKIDEIENDARKGGIEPGDLR